MEGPRAPPPWPDPAWHLAASNNPTRNSSAPCSGPRICSAISSQQRPRTTASVTSSDTPPELSSARHQTEAQPRMRATPKYERLPHRRDLTTERECSRIHAAQHAVAQCHVALDQLFELLNRVRWAYAGPRAAAEPRDATQGAQRSCASWDGRGSSPGERIAGVA